MNNPNKKNVFLYSTNIYGTVIGKLISEDRLNENQLSFAFLRSDGLGGSPNEEDITFFPSVENTYLMPNEIEDLYLIPCHLMKRGVKHPFCPRTILEKAVLALKSIGYEVEVGFEIEFFLLNQDLSYHVKNEPIIPAYNIYGTLKSYDYLSELNNNLQQAKIDSTSIAHEGGQGQFEFSLKHCSPLKAVDQLVIFKIIAKELARKQNLIACFMPKPFNDDFGSSAQINISVKNKPEKVQMSAIAGMIKHASAIMAFTCPIVNSYKRLTNISGNIGVTWAPTKISYGYNNRSSLIRYVPRDNRIEYRASDFSGNMYLSLAALLFSVYDGLKNSMVPPKPIENDMFNQANDELEELPRTLYDAIQNLSMDDFLKNNMGKDFIDDYIWNKEREWFSEMMHISNEERRRFFDV